MWKKWLALSVAFAFAAGAVAWGQEEKPPKPGDKYRPDDPREEDEDDLTPEKALAMLKEVEGLMNKSEGILHDCSRGKALETEEEIVKKLKTLLEEEAKRDPAVLQKKILETIRKLMQKSEGAQKSAIERMNEIIRKAKS